LIEIAQTVLAIAGTVLWFVGPVYSRVTPEGLGQVARHADWFNYIAADAIRLKKTDSFQVIGVTVIVVSTVLHYPFVLPLIICICLPPVLWFVRTVFYFARWAEPTIGHKLRGRESEEVRIDNPALKARSKYVLKTIIRNRRLFFKFYICDKEVIGVATIGD